jgi:hypothetical protein
MPKLKPSLFKFKGTLIGVTVVDSATYGTHTRAARGTHTPISINDELVASGERLKACNKPAKLIFDAVRDEHKDGWLWPDLLSVFRKQLKEDGAFSFKDLLKHECHRTHKLDKLLHGQFTVDAQAHDSVLDVTINLLQHPKWDKKLYLKGYQLSVTAVYPDLEQNISSKAVAHTPIILFTDKLEPLHFELPMPAPDVPWILFMRVTASSAREVYNFPQHKGMAIVKTHFTTDRALRET